MDTVEAIAPIPETVFTNQSRATVSAYKRKFNKTWKKTPPTNPERFKPNLKIGLTAVQVKSRIDDCLVNYVKRGTTKSIGAILFTNICTFYNLLALIIGAILIYTMLVLQPQIPAEYFTKDANGARLINPIQPTSLLFLVIFGINMLIGIVQELRAKFTIEKLTLVASSRVTALREGQKQVLYPADLVLDDIVLLSAGGQIQADGVLLDGVVEVNESLLTGESVPVQKKPGDRLLAGSFIVSGSGKYHVERIGKDNYIQTVANTAGRYVAPRSELFKSLKSIIKVIGVFIAILTMALITMQIITVENLAPHNVLKIITQTSGAILGMIPAGMFLLSSMALMVGVVNLGKENTWVRELYCIEMLARVNTLCLDKTGTITDGTMKVIDVVAIKNEGKKMDFKRVMSSMLFALEDNNQTSLALKDYFGQECTYKVRKILPFSSARKMSAVTFGAGLGTFVMGAPEFIFNDMSAKLNIVINKLTSQGYRVLGVGRCAGEIKDDALTGNVSPVALITLQDNIRREAPQTIKWFADNGVDIRIISGDNPITVSEVARRAGVVGSEKYISLHGLSNNEVRTAAKEYTIFGRVTPEQKLLLIKEFKNNGRMVAMTGDGVNDILALREADCSIAMASGSEAARNVSQLVLLDSNFSSMPKVVLEGRRVVNNVQKSSSLFLFKTLLTIMLTIVCVFFNEGLYFFDTTNLLILESMVIGIPGFMLALERNSQQIKGKFMFNIIKTSLSAAIVAVLFVVALMIFRFFDIFDLSSDDIFRTMTVYAVLTTGFAMLYRMIRPVNVFRGIMFVVMVVLSLFLIGYFPDLFGMIKLTNEVHYLMVMLMAFMGYALTALFDGLLSQIKLSTGKNS
ncbi:MAG: HAD-IC family P-type ATPase [Eubacteriales bacterium]|nr:HAD-IC family P-type ATPase [Eubacteriales bacterium]